MALIRFSWPICWACTQDHLSVHRLQQQMRYGHATNSVDIRQYSLQIGDPVKVPKRSPETYRRLKRTRKNTRKTLARSSDRLISKENRQRRPQHLFNTIDKTLSRSEKNSSKPSFPFSPRREIEPSVLVSFRYRRPAHRYNECSVSTPVGLPDGLD